MPAPLASGDVRGCTKSTQATQNIPSTPVDQSEFKGEGKAGELRDCDEKTCCNHGTADYVLLTMLTKLQGNRCGAVPTARTSTDVEASADCSDVEPEDSWALRAHQPAHDEDKDSLVGKPHGHRLERAQRQAHHTDQDADCRSWAKFHDDFAPRPGRGERQR
mmetsp:Transcript_122405/g.305530  ORF Transcript_122405/g.305530 Transcript_122405/m.305530 type:complete len:162 (-) Transcript_122405:1216-1701(-)